MNSSERPFLVFPDYDDLPEHNFLVFNIDHNSYALPILSIVEIIEIDRIMPLSGVPTYVLGVINFRGKVVPIIDFRQRFALATAPNTPTSLVIVIEEKNILTGILVDHVGEVTRIPHTDLSAAAQPPLKKPDSIDEITMHNNQTIVIVNVSKLLGLPPPSP